MIQNTVWLTTLVGIGFITVVYLYVFLQSGMPADADSVKQQWYGIRPWWFALLVTIIIIALGATLSSLPYAATHHRASTKPDLTVEATAHQWYWELSRTEVPVGREVAFEVRSADVNHGFAIYDDQDRMIVQTQAMPGYTNIVRHTFEESGTYRILCLEYCGLAHHAMITDFTVTAAE